MIIDALLALAGSITGNTVTGQATTGTGVTVVSTNTVDLGAGVRDMGEGQELFGRIEIVTPTTDGTSIEYQVIAADAAALTGNVKVLGTTGAIPIAQLIAGARFVCAINPRLASKGQRYLGLQYVTVGAVTTGSFYGDVGHEITDGAKFYPNGFAVL